jgi:hypothetical protein
MNWIIITFYDHADALLMGAPASAWVRQWLTDMCNSGRTPITCGRTFSWIQWYRVGHLYRFVISEARSIDPLRFQAPVHRMEVRWIFDYTVQKGGCTYVAGPALIFKCVAFNKFN